MCKNSINSGILVTVGTNTVVQFGGGYLAKHLIYQGWMVNLTWSIYKAMKHPWIEMLFNHEIHLNNRQYENSKTMFQIQKYEFSNSPALEQKILNTAQVRKETSKSCGLWLLERLWFITSPDAFSTKIRNC